MKKTLIALFAVAGIASGATTLTDGLQWAESFGDGYDQEATFSLNNAFYEENGTGVAGGGYEDSRIWTTNLSGGNFTNAFTFSFTLVNFDAANWTNALALYSNGITYGESNSIQLQKDNNGNLMVYTSGFTGSNVSGDAANFSLGAISDLLGKQITLTYSDNVLTGYVDGAAISDTVTFTFADDVTPSTALTGFQFGAAFGDNRVSTSVTVDNIAVWNRALTADEVAVLPIPEPATASLSLLGLAALMIRRRRA